MVPQPEYACPPEIYYTSLLREDQLQVCLGMTVYVLRAFKEKAGQEKDEKNNQQDSDIFTGPGGIPHKTISPIKGPSKEAASLAPANYPTYTSINRDTVS